MTYTPSNIPSETPGDLLAQGQAALERGDRDLARQLLGQAVRISPQDARGWLCLATVLDDPERRRYCLERCLTLNPSNEAARRALAELDRQPSAPTMPAAQAAPDVAPAATPETPAPPADVTPPAAAPAPAPPAMSSKPGAAGTPLAARLAAAEERRGTQPSIRHESRPRVEHEAGTEPRAGKGPGPRVRRISEPPLVLKPVTLSEVAPEAARPLTDEEVAQAALRQLLHHGGDGAGGRASDAERIAKRYFGTSRKAAERNQQPGEALQALGLGRAGRPARIAGVMSVVLVLGVLMLLLFGALLAMV